MGASGEKTAKSYPKSDLKKLNKTGIKIRAEK